MTSRIVHELKTWPEFFLPLSTGAKTFEIRKNDRDFKVGDVLRLSEWDPQTMSYSGAVCYRAITYITDFPSGLRDGFVCMGLSL